MLVAATERRARELARAADPARIVLRNAVLRADPAARDLLERRGYTRADEHMRMVADLGAPPPAPGWPDGVVAEAFDPDTDGPAVDACVVEAFSNAWANQAQWREQKVADPRFDRRLWIVARDGVEVCGAALCMPDTFGMGFVREPRRAGTVAAARAGDGASAREASAGSGAGGERHVGLGVDGDNIGARRLYEGLGMRIAWIADAYEKDVRA